MAADPVKIDPKHYQVEFENDRIRILRISYGPHERSVMHWHPAAVVVMLTDCDFKFYLPQGKVQGLMGKGGQILCFEEPFEHEPVNLSGRSFEAILVELKT